MKNSYWNCVSEFSFSLQDVSQYIITNTEVVWFFGKKPVFSPSSVNITKERGEKKKKETKPKRPLLKSALVSQ